ncbi:MAG: LytTR family DNA-binding domain-containing protein [bacterium]
MNENQKIRVVIVDDEPEGRDVMKHLLGSFPDIEISAVADSADSGLEAIARIKPDMVFLDIQMPRKNGFDLVHDLMQIHLSPVIVFVTAFDQYAIRAIRMAAFDFLTKPVDPDELRQTIIRYSATRESYDFNTRVATLLEQINPTKKLRFNTRSGFVAVNPGEILYIRADGNYSELFYSRNRNEIICMNIGGVGELLPENQFFRASRSVIINLSYIHRIERKTHSCELVKDGETISVEISRDRVHELERLF